MIPPTKGANMARNGNTESTDNRTEFVVNLDDDFTRRETVLEQEINQHRIALEVKEDELVRVRAAKKALSS
jgi:hypothetical protein